MIRQNQSAQVVDLAAIRGKRSLQASLSRLDDALSEQRRKLADFRATMRQLDEEITRLESTWQDLGQAAATVDVAPLRTHCAALGQLT